MSTPLNANSVVARNSELVTAPLGDDLMMLNIAQGAYFGLNDIGATIWESIAAPTTVGAICTRLQAEFVVEPAQCEAEVIDFLAQLCDAGLAHVVG